MSTEVYALIETVFFFGGIFAFAFWQLHVVRKSIAEDKARKARGEPPEAERGRNERRSKEDVFWDTVTRKRN
ncbi:MAG: hypothetical protein AAF074_04410 [Pseudomonadota bacterium]